MISLNVIYWDMGCEYRKRNAIISWNENKKMVQYLKDKVDVRCNLFEFGNDFIFEDSIKIKDELDYYEKSKKNNMIINHDINKSCEYFSIIDSDVFFVPDQYEMLLNHFMSIKNENIFYTYNLRDIDEENSSLIITDGNVDYDKLKSIDEKLSWRHSYGSGVLGGFFIVPYDKLLKINGFNEKFLTWGVEDDEAFVRLKYYCNWVPQMFNGPYHLYHPKNLNDKKFYIPVYTDEYFEINKVNKERKW